MTWLIKIINKINCSILLFFSSSIFLANLSFAADGSANIQKTFRDQLIANVGSAFLSNPLVGWNNGLIKSLFVICTAIAIFQIFYRDYGSSKFLISWVKLIISMFICMAIFGYSETKVPRIAVFSGGKAATAASLDMNIYYGLSERFDALADALEAGGGPAQYQDASKKLFTMMSNIRTAVSNCGPADKGCVVAQLKQIENGQIERDKEAKSGGILGEVGAKILDFIDMISTPYPFWIIHLLTWILEILRLAINYWTLITFSLVTAISLFFCKVFTVFMVLPDFRGKVLNAYKMPLSATMYGFLTSLLIFCGTQIINGVNKATVAAIVAKAGTDSGVDSFDLLNVLMGASFSALAVVGLQIIAMTKVPGLCRALWDLSFEELTNIGKTMLEAGMGALKLAGGAAILAGGTALTGGAGAIAGFTRGAGFLGKLKSGFSGATGGAMRGANAMSGAMGGNFGGLSNLLGGVRDDDDGGGVSGGVGSAGIPRGTTSSGSAGGSGGGSGEGGGSGGGSGAGGGSGGSSGGGSASTSRVGLKSDKAVDDALNKEKNLQAKSRARKIENMFKLGQMAVGGVTTVAKMGIDVGKGDGLGSISFSGLGGQISGVGATFGGIRQGYIDEQKTSRDIQKQKEEAYAARSEEIIENEAITKSQQEALALKNSDQIFNSSDLITQEELINEAEMNQLAEGVTAGTASQEEITRFDRYYSNGNMRALKKETIERANIARRSENFEQYKQQKQKDWNNAVNQMLVRDKSGKVVDLDYSKAGSAAALMSTLNRTDLANQDVRNLYREIRAKQIKETESNISQLKVEAAEMRNNNKIAEAREAEDMASRMKKDLMGIQNAQDIPSGNPGLNANKPSKQKAPQWEEDLDESTDIDETKDNSSDLTEKASEDTSEEYTSRSPGSLSIVEEKRIKVRKERAYKEYEEAVKKLNLEKSFREKAKSEKSLELLRLKNEIFSKYNL